MLKNGPIVVDWYQPPSARAYSSGVFKGDGGGAGFSSSIVPNHASVLLGWGESEANQDEKYWILRNSFGPDFGMKGDMLVETGSFGIGGSISGFDVDFV